MIPILFEDEFCIAFLKPNNVLIHHSHYARNIEEDSLMEILKSEGYDSVFPVHRLDRKTSGVILCAKAKNNVSHFQQLFDSQSIQKTYHALLRGHVTESGIIDSPVKNDRGNYKEAETYFSCLQHFTVPIPVEPYSEARYSLVEFRPKTGRMHQLRIHANKISHPIIGDHKYGNRHHNRMFEETLLLPNLFLHALRLEFQHPFTQEIIQINASKPDFWLEFETKIASI